MIHLPASLSAGAQIGALVLAQEAISELGGLAATLAGPTTILGAMIVAERYLRTARAEALALSRETAADAVARLDAEQERWAEQRAGYEAEIAQLKATISELSNVGAPRPGGTSDTPPPPAQGSTP